MAVKPKPKTKKPATQQQASQQLVVRTRSTNYADEFKQAALEMVLVCGGNVRAAARQLSIHEDTLRRWALGENVSSEIYQDYQDNMRARVRERVSAMHATRDEVLSIAAVQVRGDMADVVACLDESGKLDWDKAKLRDVSRLIKKFKITRRDCKSVDGEIEPEITTELELVDSFRPLQLLAQIHGLVQQRGENKDDAETRRAFWREQIEHVAKEFELDEAGARAWLLANVNEARNERDWLM